MNGMWWNQVYLGSCERMDAIPDGSVHCVVTSPPYFGLRDYATAEFQGGDASCDHSRKTSDKVGASTINGDKKSANSSHAPWPGGVCGKCGAVRADEQIGHEPTVAEYVERMVGVFREVRRVLRDDGVAFLNLGDSYAGSSGAQGRGPEPASDAGSTSALSERSIAAHPKRRYTGSIRDAGLKPKDLIGVPWRTALALQADGWWLRDAIIWHKPATIPSSVEDRCTPAYEFVFMLTKRPRYFVDMDAVRQPLTASSVDRVQQPGITEQEGCDRPNAGGKTNGAMKAVYKHDRNRLTSGERSHNRMFGEPDTVERLLDAGANLRNVWTIATEPFAMARYACANGHEFVLTKRMSDEVEAAFRCRACGKPVERGEHFAAFPGALAARCIRMGTSEAGCCSECGAPLVRVVEVAPNPSKGANAGERRDGGAALTSNAQTSAGLHRNGTNVASSRVMRGFQPSCKCTGGISPCVVLDPFMGTGTTAEVAESLGRRWVGYELSQTYHALIAERTKQLGLFSDTAL